MSFVPFPDGTVEIHFNGQLDGIPVQNVLGAKLFTGAATYTDGLALAAALHAFFVAENWFTQITPNYEQENIEVVDLSSASGWTADLVTGSVGTNAGGQVQSQVAMVVTLQTAKRGRSYRGRNFVPGLATAALLNSKEWNPAAQTQWDNYYSDLIASIQAAGWTPVVLSRIQAKAELALGITTPIVSVRANAKLGTIRGRLT